MSPESRNLQSGGGMERIPDVLRSKAAMRVYAVLGALLVAFLWYNAVRRAITPGSSHYVMFIDFSRDLIFDRINLYVEYSVTNTVTKYPPFMALIFAPLVPLPLWLGASIWFWVNLGLAVGAAYFGVLTVREAGVGIGDRGLFVIPFVLAAGIIGSNLEVTQINHLTLFLLCWSLYAFKQGKDIGAGALIGVAAALKLTPVCSSSISSTSAPTKSSSVPGSDSSSAGWFCLRSLSVSIISCRSWPVGGVSSVRSSPRARLPKGSSDSATPISR